MKEVKIYDQEKYDWALDSALKALSREDKKAFMNRIWDMSVVSNISQTDILYMFAQSAYSTSLQSSFIFGGHKYDTASLTVQDLWKLKQAAYREGYLHAMEVRQYRDYGLEG